MPEDLAEPQRSAMVPPMHTSCVLKRAKPKRSERGVLLQLATLVLKGSWKRPGPNPLAALLQADRSVMGRPKPKPNPALLLATDRFVMGVPSLPAIPLEGKP